MTFRLAQISDTHLSAAHPEFVANFDRLAAHLRERKFDLVVNTGDISAHGELAADDLHFALARHQALGLDWLAIPGNHDVGNDPAVGGKTPADAPRLRRWLDILGPDHFLRDIPGWRLIGLDTLITDTDLPQAEAQFAFLQQALDGAGSRRIGLFLHKPLCEQTMAETIVTYWSVQEAPRHRMLALLRQANVGFVASGHVHQWRDRGHSEGLRQVWAPAVAFMVGDTWQHAVGEKRLGYVEHLLYADGRHECQMVEVEGLVRNDLGLMPHAYGPQPVLAVAESV
jgi:3',5'-cyclic AMP phosphodiesterase CpdA